MIFSPIAAIKHYAFFYARFDTGGLDKLKAARSFLEMLPNEQEAQGRQQLPPLCRTSYNFYECTVALYTPQLVALGS